MKPGRAEPVALAALSESLRPLRLSSPGEQQSLQRSLAEIGQLSPILVFSHGDKLELIDGFKRLGAARSLGWTKILGTQLDVTMMGAKIRLWQSNSGGALSELEEAWLVQSLHRQDKLTQDQIGQLFGRHKSWVNRRLILVETLCEEAQAAVRLGLLSATSARELCRLPRGNQAQAAHVVTQRGLTKRQTALLVDAMLSARDVEVEPDLLAERLQAKASERKTHSRSRRTPGEWILSDVDLIKRTCGKLQARLLERSLSSLGPEAAKRCKQALYEMQNVLNALCRTIEQTLNTERDNE